MIPKYECELTTDQMAKHCKNFMKRVQDTIGNSKQPLFYCTNSNRVYYSDLGATNNSDKNLLLYGEYIQYHKEVEFNKAYIEVLDNYIGAKVVVPGKYSITVLTQVKLAIGKEYRNSILNTRVYVLEFPYIIVYEYAVNIIIDNIIDQIDDQVWNIGILEDILYFLRDPDLLILTKEQAYTNVIESSAR